ncbi:hypothetical protein N7523_005756 [Penicillium sp. IBT 18751x]|nr:hypothetical protein N7523_005652 [Penicillium sp. IBT 18751x]KAJ6118005.1 hypothetical protein N7523_005756 [Penicillium sp. IBT 18751x]
MAADKSNPDVSFFPIQGPFSGSYIFYNPKKSPQPKNEAEQVEPQQSARGQTNWQSHQRSVPRQLICGREARICLFVNFVLVNFHSTTLNDDGIDAIRSFDNVLCLSPSERLVTPVTPATFEILNTLRSTIEENMGSQDACGKLRFQIMLNATEKPFAVRSVLLRRNQELLLQNNEKKPRQGVRSTVGKPKVQKYEAIV